MNMTRADSLALKGLGILFALGSGVSLVQLPSTYEQEVDFHSQAIRATGTVVKTREETQISGGGGIIPLTTTKKYISTVKFQTNQAESVEFTTSSACSSRRDCENKTVSVLYDPSHPKDAIVDSGSTPEGKFRTGMVLSAVFLLLGIAAILQRFLG
jgi:hypothetical protein